MIAEATPLLKRAFRGVSFSVDDMEEATRFMNILCRPKRVLRVSNPIAPYSLNSVQSVRSGQIQQMLERNWRVKGLGDLFPEPGAVDEFVNRPFTKEELRKYYMSKGRYKGNHKKFIP